MLRGILTWFDLVRQIINDCLLHPLVFVSFFVSIFVILFFFSTQCRYSLSPVEYIFAMSNISLSTFDIKLISQATPDSLRCAILSCTCILSRSGMVRSTSWLHAYSKIFRVDLLPSLCHVRAKVNAQARP